MTYHDAPGLLRGDLASSFVRFVCNEFQTWDIGIFLISIRRLTPYSQSHSNPWAARRARIRRPGARHVVGLEKLNSRGTL